jgi:hypothetical protein
MGDPTFATSTTSASTPPPRGDEVTPIVEYMIREMGTNARSEYAGRIRALNQRNIQQCVEDYQALAWWQQLLWGSSVLDSCTSDVMTSKVAALGQWGWQVRENGPWDHKPLIRKRFKPANPQGKEQHWHHYNGYLYYYDIWSNIHYGYVGRACGFSPDQLLDGAGVEQVGSDLWNGRRPSATPGVSGMRRFDDPSDRAAVSMGINLYPRTPSVGEVLRLVTTTPGLTRRPLQ